MDLYDRVYMHIQRANQVSSKEEVLNLMPLVLKEFRNGYLIFKMDIEEWNSTPDPEQTLLEKTLRLKKVDMKNQILSEQISNLTSQIDSMAVHSPKGSKSSSSGSMPTIHGDVKEIRANIFSQGPQIKRTAEGAQRGSWSSRRSTRSSAPMYIAFK